MSEEEEVPVSGPTPTLQNNWVAGDKKDPYDEEALRKQYEANYGRSKDNDSSCCSCMGMLKLLALMVIALVASIAIFAYNNPEWEGWEVLMPMFPANASYMDKAMHSFDHFKSEETWTNFGDYLVTNTSAAMSVKEAYADFQNNSIGNMIVNAWDNLDIKNSSFYSSMGEAFDTVNGTLQESMKTGEMLMDNSTIVTQFLSDTWNDINMMVSNYTGSGKSVWATIEDFGKNLTMMAQAKFNETMDMVM